MHTHQARSGDLFLLCSDGLTSMVRQDRIREIVAGSESLRTAADRLVAEANEMGGRDNITVVLFRLGGEEPGAGPGVEETVVGAPAVEADTDTHEVDAAPPAAAAEFGVTQLRSYAGFAASVGGSPSSASLRCSWCWRFWLAWSLVRLLGCGRFTLLVRTIGGW